MEEIYLKYTPIYYIPLNQIHIFDWLILGNLDDALNFKGDAVLSVFNEIDKYKEHFSNKIWRYIDIYDDDETNISIYFQSAFDFLDSILAEKKTCIIHCHAGINRSATIAVAYYMYKKKYNLFTIYENINILRPGVISNISFRKQLIRWSFEHNLL